MVHALFLFSLRLGILPYQLNAYSKDFSPFLGRVVENVTDAARHMNRWVLSSDSGLQAVMLSNVAIGVVYTQCHTIT